MKAIVVCVVVFLCLFSGRYGLVRPNPAWMTGRRLNSPLLKVPALLDGQSLPEPALRIGHGYDIHRLAEGKPLIIAGVHVPYKLGADAHSDGDAVYHR